MKRVALVLLWAGLAVTGVWAQESHPAGGHQEAKHEAGGHEQSSDPTLIWRVLNFAMLAGVLYYLGKKNLVPFLQERLAKIQDGIAGAQEEKRFAESEAADVEARLAQLPEELAAMRERARKEAEAESAHAQSRVQEDLRKVADQAEREIVAAGRQAQIDLRRHATSLAVELAKQRASTLMTPDIEDALLDRLNSGVRPVYKQGGGR